MNNIGQRIKDLREANHLSQTEVAKICGSSQATVAKTENGKTPPSIKLLLQLNDPTQSEQIVVSCLD